MMSLEQMLMAGPYPGEDFHRMKITGNGETSWINIKPSQLATIVALIEEDSNVAAAFRERAKHAEMFDKLPDAHTSRSGYYDHLRDDPMNRVSYDEDRQRVRRNRRHGSPDV
jgi:hypothetical protein